MLNCAKVFKWVRTIKIMNKEAFKKLLASLEGLDYFFISGFAVSIYLNGKKSFGDLDLVVHEKDIDRFANKIGAKLKRRLINKGTFTVNDYGFETKFLDLDIEATSGYPIKRVKENTFNKLFKYRVKRDFQGLKVYLAPIEEVLAQKAFFNREKDKKDLDMLKGIKFSKDLLLEISNDVGEKDKIIKNLKERGYKV